MPVSEWATPQQITNQLRAEGLPVPQSQSSQPMLPPPPGGGAPYMHAQPPQPPQPVVRDSAPFIAAPAFSGAKPGYAFKAGPRGLGYYLEGARPTPSAPVLPTPVSSASDTVAPSGGSSSHGERNITRTIGGVVWQDKALLEFPEDDFRIFVGDLGNEVNDDVLSHAFQRYPSFQIARVVRDKQSGKTKGYGFVSFKDPWDMTKALREMQGKYVGNRPMKLRKSTAQDRTVTETNQPLKFNHAVGVADKSTQRKLLKGGAIQKKPSWKQEKKKKNMPW